MEPPLGSQPARTRPTPTAGRSMLTGGPWQSASTSGQSLRSIDPESPGEPREGDTLRTAPNPSQRLPDKLVCGYAMFPRFPSPGPVCAVATPAPERFAHLWRLSLALLLSALPVTGAGGAFLPRQGLGVFRHAWVREKRSQPLTQEKNIMANQKPVEEVRIGRVKATVWRNGTDEQPRYNVTFSRLYKEGDQWKSTQSFGRNDLLVLAKVADLVHTRILQLPAEAELRRFKQTSPSGQARARARRSSLLRRACTSPPKPRL